MKEAHERLQAARDKAGYPEAADAARALGVKAPTYHGHENGNRGFKKNADKYARKFGVSLEWLLTGNGPRERKIAPLRGELRTVPMDRLCTAPALKPTFTPAGQLGSVPAPDGATESTVAVESGAKALVPYR